MENDKDKKKRSSSKSKDKDSSSGDKKSSDKDKSKTRSSSKEKAVEDKAEKQKSQEKASSKETNGHSKDKEHKSRDSSKSKSSNDKESKSRDDSKSKSNDKISVEKRSESKEKSSKNDTKKQNKEDGHVSKSSDKKSKSRDDKNKEETSSIPVKVKEARKSSAKSKRVENGYNDAKQSVSNDNDDDEYNYEEDFEDYEEDFEDDDAEEEEKENEVVESSRNGHLRSDDEDEKEENVSIKQPETAQTVRQSKPAENDEKRKSNEKNATEVRKDSADSRPRTVQSRIDFTKAKQSEMQIAALGKVKRREKELLSLIEMDISTYDLFDLAPIRDYEFFIQNFGKSNMKQVQLQTDDDAVEREIQTDEFDVENKWSQYPPTDLTGCGSDQPSTTSQEGNNYQIDTELFNSVRFRRFIEKSGKLVFQLLEEVSSAMPSFQNKADISISEGCSPLSLGLLSKQYRTSCVLIAPDHSNLLVTAFYVKQNDGSIIVWDLHESEALHRTIPWKKDEIPLRSPTYNTAYLLRENESEENFINPVVGIVPVGTSTKNLSGQSNNVTAYQIAALEETGIVTIWTVLTTASNDVLESDLGLSPGGRLKLVKSAVLKPSTGPTRAPSSDLSVKRFNAHSFCLGYSPLRPADFYIGTDTGYVLHVVRHENKSGPSLYRPELEAISDVLCLHFSPFEPTVLLAGLSDGSVCLYKTNFTKPLGVFQLNQNNEPITSVQWSPNSPYIFYSLHGQTKLACWDLKHNKQAPVQLEKVKPVKSMSLSSFVYSEEQIRSKVYMILAFVDETVEVHCLNSSSGGKYSREDGQKLLTIVERL